MSACESETNSEMPVFEAFILHGSKQQPPAKFRQLIRGKLVEFISRVAFRLTLLIQENNVATGKVDGVSGTQARHYAGNKS